MSCLTASGDAFLFGGWLNGNDLGDSWKWNGTDWVAVLTVAAPSPRHWLERSLCYDAGRDEIVLFGGVKEASASLYGDTWTFDGAEWRPKLDYVTSPVNGNRYALTSPMTWPEAESLAVLEGGHLATVRNQQEHNWLFQTFPPLNGGGANLFMEDAFSGFRAKF